MFFMSSTSNGNIKLEATQLSPALRHIFGQQANLYLGARRVEAWLGKENPRKLVHTLHPYAFIIFSGSEHPIFEHLSKGNPRPFGGPPQPLNGLESCPAILGRELDALRELPLDASELLGWEVVFKSRRPTHDRRCSPVIYQNIPWL